MGLGEGSRKICLGERVFWILQRGKKWGFKGGGRGGNLRLGGITFLVVRGGDSFLPTLVHLCYNLTFDQEVLCFLFAILPCSFAALVNFCNRIFNSQLYTENKNRLSSTTCGEELQKIFKK